MGKLKHLGSCLLVWGLDNLVTGRRDFELLIEDGPLLLQPDGVRTVDEASEISLELDVLPNAKLLRPFLRGFTIFFGLLFLHEGWGRSYLLPRGLFSFLLSWKREQW